MSMKVLAIDPGYGRCGLAIVEKNGGERETLLHSECVETNPSDDFPVRLVEIVTRCARLITAHEPDCVAIEKLFVTKNQKTAMRVSEVRGALIALAAERGLPVSEYTPGEVKAAAAGWGGADKQQVAKMLHALVRIEKPIKHDDEYDAIAVAVTHLARSRT